MLDLEDSVRTQRLRLNLRKCTYCELIMYLDQIETCTYSTIVIVIK